MWFNGGMDTTHTIFTATVYDESEIEVTDLATVRAVALRVGFDQAERHSGATLVGADNEMAEAVFVAFEEDEGFADQVELADCLFTLVIEAD